MKYLVCAALCAASLPAVSVPANATQIIVTYAGKVNSGFDVDGLFGAVGVNLKRQDYTLSFTVDTSSFQSFAGDPSSGLEFFGPVVATMTVGQQSYTINGSMPDSNITRWAPAAPDGEYDYQINAYAEATNGDWVSGRVGSLYNFFGDLGLTAPFSHAISNSDDAYTADFSGLNTALDLKISSISMEVVASSAPAPEPASWALMVGGFGLVGAIMRRRQRTLARFAA
jgi:hypothetical protein